MQVTVEDEPDLTLPEDSIHRARLEEVKERTFNYTKAGENKVIEKLEWWWEITASSLGPEYVGRRVKGETTQKFTNRPGNKFHEWAQVLLNRELPVGMGIDTDDLVGLEAEIVIGHQPNMKDPSRPWEIVSDVAPIDGQYNEPPF